jgi:alanine racemase
MNARATAEILTANLRHNASVLHHLAGQRELVGVIKADGYGHGAATVATAVAPYCKRLAVAFTDEALRLRKAGVVDQPVVVLQGAYSKDEFAYYSECNLQPVIHQAEQIEALRACRLSKPLTVWLKVDTGMRRLGFSIEQANALVPQLKNLPQVTNLILMTHFANADNLQHRLNLQQQQRLQTLAQHHPELRLSLHNSPALHNPTITVPGHLVRAGISLYGQDPTGQHQHLLKPTMRFTAPVVDIVTHHSGVTLAQVAVGYADGYPRNAKTVHLSGRPVPIVGPIQMDQLWIDVSQISSVKRGQRAELWGESLLVKQVADEVGTISYELLCAVAARVPRLSQS